MKSKMKSSLTGRFSNIEESNTLKVATLLDPRFKDKFSTSQFVKTNVEATFYTIHEEIDSEKAAESDETNEMYRNVEDIQ